MDNLLVGGNNLTDADQNIGNDKVNNTRVGYSLPRVFTTQIQCAFGTYFWEMYTFEFGWSPAEYGKVQSLFNLTQCIFFILFGIIFNIIDSVVTGSGGGTSDKAAIQSNLNWIKIVEIVAIGFHSSIRATKFIICLPIMPIKGTRYLVRKIRQSRFGACFTNIQTTDMFNLSPELLNQPPKPPAQCAGCFNTPRMNAWKRFMGTRAFCVYFLVVIHGISFSAFELCNKAIPVIIYPKKITEAGASGGTNKHADDKNAKFQAGFADTGNDITAEAGSGQVFDKAASIRGLLITYNILFFTVTNFIIILIFSLVRYFRYGCARLAETFFIVSIVFTFAQIPILIGFYNGTAALKHALKGNNESNSPSTQNTRHTVDRRTGGTKTIDKFFYYADPEKLVLALCLTVFHSTVFFWIFTGGPLTNYVSTNLLNVHKGIMSFGVLVIVIGFAGINVIFSCSTNFHAKAGDVAKVVFDPKFKKGVLFVCILTQFFTLLVFRPFCSDCGEPQYWKTYLVLVATGATNTMFVTYIYIMLDDVVKTHFLMWVFYGVFFAITNFTISKAMGVMFGAFGGQGVTGFEISSIQVVIEHNFPSVYKSITYIFWFANFIAFFPVLAGFKS